MNRSRVDFKRDNDFKITPYWVLGFVEAEGSFFISKGENFQFKTGFNITQSLVDLALMEKIRNFLLNLSVKNKTNYSHGEKVVNLSVSQTKKVGKQAVLISSYNTAYFNNVLIPFFYSMTWQSKKELDYLYWKTVLKLKQLGHNYTELGYETIELISSSMNIKRLSTNPDKDSVVKIEVLPAKQRKNF